LLAFTLTSTNIPESSVFAQEILSLPAPGVMVHLSHEFNPPILKGIKVHTDNPFRFDFILDKGDSQLSNDALKDESSKLIKYFLASLTIPEKDLWVNLSPYEKDRIIPNSFGLTEMGRDLLAEDYMLKQITASLIYPEDEIGKKFWKRIYEESARKLGTTNVPVNTFNKVWIVPEKAIVYENAKAGTAYVMESKLKVMLEEDYLSLEKHEGIQSDDPQGKNVNQIGSQIVREIVIPELTKEVNEDKNFIQLRQVYNSLILAAWYKKKVKDSILSQIYSDKNKIVGINIDDPKEKEKIYQQYLKAFKKGVYNYIKEDIDPISQETIPRKYFSGGESLYQVGSVLKITKDRAMLGSTIKKNLIIIGASLSLAVGSFLYYSSQNKAVHFAPTGNEILLIVGQQKEIIDQYVKNVGIPAGFMTYTSIQNLEGLTSPADMGAGTQNAQYLVDHYPNTVLEIGLNMVGALDDVDNGKYGENIKKLGDWIKQAKHPVFLRIGYEFDNPKNNYNPIKYKIAFRRIVDQLRQVEHVENAVFVWQSYSYGQGTTFKDYYPGDKYVDWVGMSYFEKGNEKVGAEIFRFADEKGKPKMICEASSWNTGTLASRQSWFINFFKFAHQEHVKAIGYIDSNWDVLPMFQKYKYGDDRIEQNPDILKLWNNEIRHGYLNSSKELFKEINYVPAVKNQDQAMLFRRNNAQQVGNEGPHSSLPKTKAVQNIVRNPIFFPLFSMALVGVASYFYGPIAAMLFFTPFVLTAFLGIIQDIVHVNPGEVESI
jgi:beta-mannanase